MTRVPPPLTRRGLLALGGAAAVGAGLAACGTGSGPAPSGTTSAGPSAGGGALTIWANAVLTADASKGLGAAATAYEKATGITVTVQGIPTAELIPKLTTTVSGGAGPDLAIVDTTAVPQLGASQVFADLTQRAAAISGGFTTAAVTAATYGGKQYALPYYVNNVGLYYNKDLLTGAGIAVPATWADLRSAAKELTGGDRYGYMLGAAGYGSFLFWPWLWQNGGTILNEGLTEATFADDAGLAAFEAYAGLAVTDKVVPPEFVGVNTTWDAYVAPFVQGRVAMMAVGPWGSNPITTGNPALNWGVAPLPAGTHAATILGGASIGLARNAADADQAWAFLSWLTAPEQVGFIQDTGNIPGLTAAQDSDWVRADANRAVFAAQMGVAQARPAVPNWSDIEWGTMADCWDSVISGGVAPADALTKAAADVTAKLRA